MFNRTVVLCNFDPYICKTTGWWRYEDDFLLSLTYYFLPIIYHFNRKILKFPVSKKAGKKTKSDPAMQKVIIPAESDPHKLVNYVCGSNIYTTGEDVKVIINVMDNFKLEYTFNWLKHFYLNYFSWNQNLNIQIGYGIFMWDHQNQYQNWIQTQKNIGAGCVQLHWIVITD